MPDKPTFDSVTDVACSCGHLEKAADDPTVPLSYDGRTGEFQLRTANGGEMRVFHCFFCGGSAPPSKRDSLFANLTNQEVNRLVSLTAGVTTVAEAIKRFGVPDQERRSGIFITMPGKSPDAPPQTTPYRTLTFEKLSETAEVVLVDYSPHPVRFSFMPKYVGPREGEG